MPDRVTIKNLSPKADFSRLPRFYTSNPAYDEFVNDYFMRHLSVDDRAIYTGGVLLGATDHMWVIEWDWWMLPWIDRGAMGLARQGGNDTDVMLDTLAGAAVDKYGYVYGAKLCSEPNNSLGGYKPTFGWPWPKYNRNYTVSKPTGWEFNDINDGARDQWIVRDIELEPGYVDNRLVGKTTGPKAELISPKFDVDVFQVPIFEIDIEYAGEKAADAVKGLRIYWTTDKSPRFSEERMVTVDFASLPPTSFPEDYAPMAGEGRARFPIYYPMCLHPEWGREGRRITRLKVVPTGSSCEGMKISLNYVRASYDIRLSTTNTTLINAVHKFYTWSGDDAYLARMMPRLRRAMIFLNEHLQGRAEGLLDQEWFVGHDGLGGDKPGHGLIASYWDLLPAGRWDIESSMQYYHALKAMAELERVAAKRGIKVSAVDVLGPDSRTRIAYRETPRSLEAIAKRVKARCEQVFWDAKTGRFVRNVDTNGKQHDYGLVHFNVLALAFGIGTDAQRASIVSWLNGSRVVPGDTSQGADIYHWRFGPRMTTVQNEDYYFWPWIFDRRNFPNAAPNYVFGNQMQNGGAVPFTSLFDLMARCGTGDQREIDRAYERTLQIKSWFDDVKAAGGKGTQFYRAYYDGHPERGMQQSPNPGGIGLDHEFLSDGSLGTEFLLHAFLGVDASEDGILSVTPAVPSQLDKIGVTNVYFRGNHVTVEAGRGYVSFEGSQIPKGDGLKARVTFRNAPPHSDVFVNGKRASATRGPKGSLTVTTDLRPVRIEVRGALSNS